MALNQEQKDVFQRQMRRLEEDGFFPAMKRSVADGTRYLIVSYGGTGAEALFAIKKKLEEKLPKTEYDNYIRLLAIDTDKKTQKQTKEFTKPDGTQDIVPVDKLKDKQFLPLDGSAARNDIENAVESTSSWINPSLPGMVSSVSDFLNGTGAGGYRQIGRATLFPAQTVESIETRISQLAGELTNGSADNLKVFIVTGIAGGTGSGTIIDLTYLIRKIIAEMAGDLSDRTQFGGFILLPPTGNSTNNVDINKGNRNGYAALKEIDHFMTLATRGDVYKQVLGGETVESIKAIFDVCYLMDGVMNGVAIGANARAVVKNVLADCILDMITTQPIVPNNGDPAIQVVDSFMNDVPGFVATMLRRKRAIDAPRDANYVYCTLGHGEVSIPFNLMKSYIANRIFNRMWTSFEHCRNVSDEDAEEFLRKVTVKNFIPNAQGREIVAEVDRIFQDTNSHKGGPFYVINLLAKVKDAVQLQKNKAKLFRYRQASDEQLNFINNVCTNQNNNIFNVYVAVMEEMRKVLQKEADIICDASLQENSYSFAPISLGKAAGTDNVVRTYLDGLISQQVLNQLTMEMLQEMIQNKNTWTQLFNSDEKLGAFDGVKAVRTFWSNKIDSILRATLEDFLIKYYSGNPNAHYDVNNPDDPDTVKALNAAAKEIYDQMFGAAGKAHPLADFTKGNGLTVSDFNAHKYIFIPKEAPHLKQAVENYAKNMSSDVKVFSSFARDRISCYSQYTSIPAFKLAWVCKAESIYEKSLAAADVGVHMSESPTGQLWREFPNLLPKSTWGLVPGVNYTNPRENALATRAEDLFALARKLGLTTAQAVAGGANLQVYSVKLLPANLRPDVGLYRQLDVTDFGSREHTECLNNIKAAADKCAENLFNRVSNWNNAEWIVAELEKAARPIEFASKELTTTTAVLAYSNNPSEKPAGWDETVAAQMLRKMPDTMNDLRGTLEVMQVLKKKVDELNSAAKLLVDFAKYLAADIFTYNKDFYQWEVSMPNGVQKSVCVLEPDDKTEKAAEYYLLFKGLSDKPELKNVCDKLYEEASTDSDRAIHVEKKRAIKAKAGKLKDELQKLIFDKDNPDQGTMIGTKAWETIASRRGMDVEGIRKFYTDLIEEIEIL